MERPRILVVDDDNRNQIIMQELLEDDYDLNFSYSGQSCLANVSHFEPDLILLDIMMPGADGYEVCTQLKEQDHTSDIPVICPDPDDVSTGLYELIVNAVEHGNLGIGYEEKSRLLDYNQWEQEVRDRLALDIYADRYVTIKVQSPSDEINFVIKDQGDGFECEEYLDFSTERATDCHGRGIAVANMVCFDHLQYQGNGNEVIATIHTNKKWKEY